MMANLGLDCIFLQSHIDVFMPETRMIFTCNINYNNMTQHWLEVLEEASRSGIDLYETRVDETNGRYLVHGDE